MSEQVCPECGAAIGDVHRASCYPYFGIVSDEVAQPVTCPTCGFCDANGPLWRDLCPRCSPMAAEPMLGDEANIRECDREQLTKPAEPREWFIELRNRPNHRSCVRGPATVNADGTLKTVRVVEGSAYDALAAENAKYIARNEELRATQFAAISDQAREIEKLKAERDEYKGRFEDARKTAHAHTQELTSRAADIATLTRELKEYKLWEKSVPDYLAQEVRLKNERDALRAEVAELREANKECGDAIRVLADEGDRYREALEAIRAGGAGVDANIAREALEEK